MLKIFMPVLIGLSLLWSCTPSPRYTIEKAKKEKPVTTSETATPPKGKKIAGLASFYGYNDGFNGKKTANGETFDMYGLTAAHKTWAFNTWIEVKNLSNGRTVVVRINDRGPYIGNRILDLSYGAAKELRMIEAGVQEVEITVLR